MSDALAPSVGLGFVLAPREVAAALRTRRDADTGPPPANNQAAAAIFLALGHHEACARRTDRLLAERRHALREALNHYLPHAVDVVAEDGATFLTIRAPGKLDMTALAAAAGRRGVAIERPVAPEILRLWVTSIPTEQLRGAVEALAAAWREVVGETPVTAPRVLAAAELACAMSGARLHCQTVYGDPCTIDLAPDGAMRGVAGARGEEHDDGRWWIDGDRWHRQWRSWAYGETADYAVTIEGERIEWRNAAGRLVDWARIELAPS